MTDSESALQIRLVGPDETGAVWSLQRAAFVDEALLYGTPEVPALLDTHDDVSRRIAASDFTLVGIEADRIVGAVSVRDYRPGGTDIERLMVAPDCRLRGIAGELMAAAEAAIRLSGAERVQLIVGELAVDNQRLYERLGYRAEDRFPLESHPLVIVITMGKSLSAGEKRARGFTGQVRLRSSDRELGFVRVKLVVGPEPTSGMPRETSWSGLILGSDYLMWGANHKQLTLEFADGERADVIVRATGRLVGQNAPPANLTPIYLPDEAHL